MSGAVGGGIIGGALGGGLAVTVLAPLTAANNFLGSYFFGSGMILGERQMYQDDWIKIKKRLDAGESFLVILEEVMKPNTQAVMQMARETVIAVSSEWNDIVLKYLQSIPQSIWDAINKINAGDALDNPWPLGEGIIGFVNGKVRCAEGYQESNNKCIKLTTTVAPFVPPTPPPTPPAAPVKPGGTFDITPAIHNVYHQVIDELQKWTIEQNQLTLALGQASGSKRTKILFRMKWLKTRRAFLAGAKNQMEKSYPGIKYHG